MLLQNDARANRVGDQKLSLQERGELYPRRMKMDSSESEDVTKKVRASYLR
jgi:hypothetical protein